VDLTRRNFLTIAGSAAFTPFDRARSTRTGGALVLVHPDGRSAIPESADGYAAVLAALGAPVVRTGGEAFAAGATPARAVLAASAIAWSPRFARRLVAAAASGAWVLVESGLGYAHAADGAEGRRSLHAALGVTAHDTEALWPSRAGSRVPYVAFTWPVAMKVRDFSRLVPLSAPDWNVVASVRGSTAALGRRIGRGAIVVLGSPLGPALGCGDREARRWLARFIERSPS
jgi:hypothetical protein